MIIVAAGGLVLALSIGTRLTFGLFLQPMSDAQGWGRETFALAIAIQNIVWGLTQPLFGMLADRYGSGRVIALGGAGYGLGLYLMSQASSPLGLNLTAGLLIGLSLSATSFAVVLGVVGRAVSEKRRSLALGIASAGGSVGQFAILPTAHTFISNLGWVDALSGLALIAVMLIPLSLVLSGKPDSGDERDQQSMGQAIAEAAKHRGYLLLNGGFFVCGFHVTFIATHLPAYITDNALSPGLGATALALIGFFNILGSWFWGAAGVRYPKSHSLSVLYFIRAVFITALVSFPLSDISLLLFAAAIGFTWLGTVPLTNALVGQIFGVKYIGTLFGIVFLSHQLGAFLGVWLGGVLFDFTGSYDVVWYISIALGLLAAALHWPINEQPVARPGLAAEHA